MYPTFVSILSHGGHGRHLSTFTCMKYVYFYLTVIVSTIGHGGQGVYLTHVFTIWHDGPTIGHDGQGAFRIHISTIGHGGQGAFSYMYPQ